MDLNCIPYKAAIGTRSDLWERPSIHFALQNTQDARDNFKAGCVRRSLPSLKARTNVGWVGRGSGISPTNGDPRGVFVNPSWASAASATKTLINKLNFSGRNKCASQHFLSYPLCPNIQTMLYYTHENKNHPPHLTHLRTHRHTFVCMVPRYNYYPLFARTRPVHH